jgi:hypothetical protein
LSSHLAIVNQRTKALWNAADAPTVSVDGQQARLTHPRGQYVNFDVRGSDFRLSEAEFGAKVLEPALAALREKMTPKAVETAPRSGRNSRADKKQPC